MNFIPHILLVEDSADDAFFFGRTVKKLGFPCVLTHATNGAEAVKLLPSGSNSAVKMPDIIFLDLKMPVMSGFEVLKWVQAQKFANLPSIIVLSGSNELEDRMRATSLGAGGYLEKPVTLEKLRERLQMLKARAPVEESAQTS
jgi:CheY-like chemotaxis protein